MKLNLHSLLTRGSSGGLGHFVQMQINEALADGAEVILTKEEIVERVPTNWRDASFLYIPFARKAGTSYALKGPDLTIDRNSSATEIDRAGLLDEVGNNVPRIEFDGGVPNGHLIEPQGTNSSIFSNDFTEHPWGTASSNGGFLPILQPNNAIGIDGEYSATTVTFEIPDTSNARSTLRQGFTGLGNVDQNFNAYIKAHRPEDVGKTLVWRGSSNAYQEIILEEEYKLYTNSVLAADAEGFALELELRERFSEFGVVKIDITQFQWESGLTPTSRIPTNGAAATRLAEYPTALNAQNYIPESEGAFVFKLYVDKVSSAFQYIGRLGENDDVNNEVWVGIQNNRLVIRIGTPDTSGIFYEQTPYKTIAESVNVIAFTYGDGNAFAVSANGVQVNYNNPITFIPSGFNRIEVGQVRSIVEKPGKIELVAVYNRRFSISELNNLTQLP